MAVVFANLGYVSYRANEIFGKSMSNVYNNRNSPFQYFFIEVWRHAVTCNSSATINGIWYGDDAVDENPRYNLRKWISEQQPMERPWMSFPYSPVNEQWHLFNYRDQGVNVKYYVALLRGHLKVNIYRGFNCFAFDNSKRAAKEYFTPNLAGDVPRSKPFGAPCFNVVADRPDYESNSSSSDDDENQDDFDFEGEYLNATEGDDEMSDIRARVQVWSMANGRYVARWMTPNTIAINQATEELVYVKIHEKVVTGVERFVNWRNTMRLN